MEVVHDQDKEAALTLLQLMVAKTVLERQGNYDLALEDIALVSKKLSNVQCHVDFMA